jgi:hypothetical protein
VGIFAGSDGERMRELLIDWLRSLKQFKKRFSRCKNITAKEWAGRIIPTIKMSSLMEDKLSRKG